MKDYRLRVIDRELDQLSSLPALAIEGPKGVGKTETAQKRAQTVVRLDDPAQNEIASADPKRILFGAGPVLLDEWQRAPEIWDAVRRAVDDGTPPGPFLLTGSATQAGSGEVERHSGAARIDVLRMRPMTLDERLDLQPTVSLGAFFGEMAPTISGETGLTLDDYTDEIIRSGFPGIRDQDGRAHRVRMDGYVTRVIDRDFEDELGQRVRRPESLKRWMAAYAAATATTTSFKKIRDAATPGQEVMSKKAADAYRDALVSLFVLDPINGWTPSNSHLKKLTQAPKHHLADPALAVSLLGLTKAKLVKGKAGSVSIPRGGSFLGGLFESLVSLSARVFAQSIEARTFHMRTHDGLHEIDLIIEAPSGDVLALEVKMASSVDSEDCKHLNWLHSKIGDRLKARVVVNTGPAAYRRDDGVYVVPLALLGS